MVSCRKSEEGEEGKGADKRGRWRRAGEGGGGEEREGAATYDLRQSRWRQSQVTRDTRAIHSLREPWRQRREGKRGGEGRRERERLKTNKAVSRESKSTIVKEATPESIFCGFSDLICVRQGASADLMRQGYPGEIYSCERWMQVALQSGLKAWGAWIGRELGQKPCSLFY